MFFLQTVHEEKPSIRSYPQYSLSVDLAVGIVPIGEEAWSLGRVHYAIDKLTEGLLSQTENQVFVPQDYQSATEMKKAAIRTLFDGETETFNFTDPHRAAATINDWVQLKTRNLIKDLLGPDSLPADARLVLVKVCHLKADWVHPFEFKGISVPFRTVDDRSEKIVEMMHLDAPLRYAEVSELDAKVLEMPYRYSNMKLMIFLPNTVNGLDDLKSNTVNIDAIMKLMSDQLREKRTHVLLPVFDYKLKEVLMNIISRQLMHIEIMFVDDLDKISSNDLLVKKVVHKAVIEVNELGAETAAATVPESSSDPAEVYLKADHPFLYVWLDDRRVLFMGDYVGV